MKVQNDRSGRAWRGVGVWLAACVAPALASAQLAPPPDKVRDPAGTQDGPGGAGLVTRKPGEAPLVEVPFVPLEKVEVRGTGPVALILIPPHGMSWRMWDSFMERNGSRYTMYAINVPGFGGTTAPAAMASGSFYGDGVWTVNLERAILRLIEERKIDHPYLIGQGYGGHVALRILIEHPEAVSGAASLDGPATIELPKQTSPRFPRESRESFVAASVHAGEKVAEDEFIQRQKEALAALSPDAARGQVLAGMIDGSAKATFLQYMGEFYSADLWPGIADLKKPFAMMVPVPDENNAAISPNKSLKDRWKKWSQAAKKNYDLVYFEKSGPLITEWAPSELDRAVYALAHGLHIPGRNKYSSALEKFVAPDEGGPAMQPRLESEAPAPQGGPEPKGPPPAGQPAPAPK